MTYPTVGTAVIRNQMRQKMEPSTRAFLPQTDYAIGGDQLQQQSSSTSSYSPSSTRTYTSTSFNTGGNMAYGKTGQEGTPANNFNLPRFENTTMTLASKGSARQGGVTQSFGGDSSGSSSTSSGSSLGFGSSSLQNVFTDLGNIAETKAQNDQRRFREDLPFQSRIYQDFDTEAAQRTEGIDTRAREQNSNLTKDRMRLQSTLSKDEEVNKGKVQVSTTGQTRDADLKRALSVLPRK